MPFVSTLIEFSCLTYFLGITFYAIYILLAKVCNFFTFRMYGKDPIIASYQVDFGPLLAHEECSGMLDGTFAPRLKRFSERKHEE